MYRIYVIIFFVEKSTGLCALWVWELSTNKEECALATHSSPSCQYTKHTHCPMSINTQPRSPTFPVSDILFKDDKTRIKSFVQKYHFRMRAKAGRLLLPQPSSQHLPFRLRIIFEWRHNANAMEMDWVFIWAHMLHKLYICPCNEINQICVYDYNCVW